MKFKNITTLTKCDKNLIKVKNSDSFNANFAKHFTQENTPQKFLM